MSTKTLIETITRGVDDAANAEDRESAAKACEALATVLRAKPGEPLVPAPAMALAAAQNLAAASPTAFLDALIQKLEGYLPESERGEVRRSAGLRIPMVHIPTSRKR